MGLRALERLRGTADLARFSPEIIYATQGTDRRVIGQYELRTIRARRAVRPQSKSMLCASCFRRGSTCVTSRANLAQVLLALSSDRGGSRRHRNAKPSDTPLGRQDSWRASLVLPLAWSHFRSLRRRTRTQSWRWAELHFVGVRSMLQVHGRGPVLGTSPRAARTLAPYVPLS